MPLPTASSSKKKGILAKNTLINIIGKGIPFLFAVVAIPFIIRGLGTPRFGVLTYVWSVVGYFGLFDMGLGRATTKFVADQEAKDAGKLAPVIVTALVLLVVFGAIGGGLIGLATPYLVHNLLHIPADLITETQRSFYLLAFSIPILLATTGARGALKALQRFDLINAVKVPASIINFVGPLFILPFTHKLQYIVLLLVAERVVSLFIYLYYCFRDIELLKPSEYSFFYWAKKLMGFGAWLAVSNFISPIMVYMDRYIIGAILTMSAVAYYTTPYEIVSRFDIIAAGIMGVMFPAFSVYFLEGGQKLVGLYQKSIRYLLFALLPVVAFFILAANPLLYYWLGSTFAEHSTPVLQILFVGILVNSIARVPSTAIQAAGRPDLRAKLHIVELPFYLALLWYLTITLGITGVALAWLIRVAIDCCTMFYLCYKFTPLLHISWQFLITKAGGLALSICIAAIILHQFEAPLLILGCALACGLITLYITWNYILRRAERKRIIRLLSDTRSMIKM